MTHTHTLTRRLAYLASITLLLLFLMAAVFAVGAQVRAASHASVGVNAHHALAYDDPPPGH